MISAVGVAPRQTDAIRNRVGVVVDVVADEDREGPSRLKIKNVAELEIAKERLLRSGCHEVRYEAMANVLHRICPFIRAVVQILRRADEGCKRSIVHSVGESVVCVEAEVRTYAARQGKAAAVVDRNAAVV